MVTEKYTCREVGKFASFQGSWVGKEPFHFLNTIHFFFLLSIFLNSQQCRKRDGFDPAWCMGKRCRLPPGSKDRSVCKWEPLGNVTFGVGPSAHGRSVLGWEAKKSLPPLHTHTHTHNETQFNLCITKNNGLLPGPPPFVANRDVRDVTVDGVY